MKKERMKKGRVNKKGAVTKRGGDIKSAGKISWAVPQLKVFSGTNRPF